MLSAVFVLLGFLPFFLLALAVLLWPEASARLIEAISSCPAAARRARARVALRAPRSEADRGRMLTALRGARAPPAARRLAFA